MTSTVLPLASLFPAATQDQWRAQVDRVLKGADFAKKLTNRTADGIVIQPVYAKADGPIVSRGVAGPWGLI